MSQEFHIGLGSMAVPGNIAGVFHFHKRLGRLPFEIVAEPAIHYAKNGVELNDFQSFCLSILKVIMTSSPEARKIHVPKGELLQPGDIVYNQDFADTLAYLAENGPQEFYEGEIAQRLVQDCQDGGDT